MGTVRRRPPTLSVFRKFFRKNFHKLSFRFGHFVQNFALHLMGLSMPRSIHRRHRNRAGKHLVKRLLPLCYKSTWFVTFLRVCDVTAWLSQTRCLVQLVGGWPPDPCSEPGQTIHRWTPQTKTRLSVLSPSPLLHPPSGEGVGKYLGGCQSLTRGSAVNTEWILKQIGYLESAWNSEHRWSTFCEVVYTLRTQVRGVRRFLEQEYRRRLWTDAQTVLIFAIAQKFSTRYI